MKLFSHNAAELMPTPIEADDEGGGSLGLRNRLLALRARWLEFWDRPLKTWRAAGGAIGPADLRTYLVLVISFSAALNLLYLAPSLYMLQVYDRVIPTGGVLTLLFLTAVLIASLAAMAGLDALRARLLTRAALRLDNSIAGSVVEATLRARRAGLPPAATIRDLDTLRQGLTSPGMLGLLDIPWTPLFIFICFIIHFWVGVLSLVGAVVIFALALINERSTRAGLTSLSSRAMQYYSAHDSDMTSAETLHALGADAPMLVKRSKNRRTYVDTQMSTSLTGANFSATTRAVRMFLQSAALGLGAYLAVERQISAGAIIAATILTARAFAPVEQIVGGWRQLGLAYAAYGSLRKLFAEMKPAAGHTPLPDPAGDIRAEGLVATAPDGRTIALSGASFAASPGEIIGIIGPSGAGKTTLARVLANAAIPRSGAVRLDGARYQDWGDRALSRHIGYLPQRIDLFDGTVAENIASFGAKDGDDADAGRVVEAALEAGAHEMILRLPNGYETELGLAGAGISPGQAQRIALARALYGKPRVVVLDEPNSHLDQDGEAALVSALSAVRKRGGVTFVVAHRAGVLSIVDKIMILREGRIIEYGPRGQVMAKIAAAQNQTNGPALVGTNS